MQERLSATAEEQTKQQGILHELREAHSALREKHDGLAQHKGALQAQILGINQEKDGLYTKVESLNKELGTLGALNREMEEKVKALEKGSDSRSVSKAENEEIGRRSMIAVQHACQCIHRALEHLTEKGGSPSILASLSLALLALQDTAGPARKMMEIETGRSMSLLAREVTWPVEGNLAQPCREALYAVALASTFSAGRKQIGDVADAANTLALICEYGSKDEIKRWAGLALGCTLMVQHVRQQALDNDAGESLVKAVTPLLEGADSNAQSFACLALGNLAVEQAARNRSDLVFLSAIPAKFDVDNPFNFSIIVHGKAAIGLCRCLSVQNMLTQRYAVGAIRNIAVSKR